MTGQFFLPNYGTAPNYSFGSGPLMGPSGLALSPATSSSFLAPAGVPGAPQLQGQFRLDQLNQQMQPNTFLPYLNAGIQGASTLGNLFLGWHGLRQAQEAATWQKQMAEKNYGNSVQSYNNAVEDRVRARYGPAAAARNQDAINAEIERRRIGGG